MSPYKDGKEINITFEKGRMIFNVGHEKYYLNEDTAKWLFRTPVENRFNDINNDDFEDLKSFDDGLYNWCLYTFLTSERYWPMSEIAKKLGVEESRLRAWVNRKLKEMNTLVNSSPGRAIEIKQELEKEYPQKTHDWYIYSENLKKREGKKRNAKS